MTVTAFSQTLRESTKQVHDRAHGSVYMGALLDGALSLEGYTRLAAQYYFIYSTLEAASDAMADDPVGAPFVIDELRRTPALVADLEFLAGPNWRAEIEPVPATEEYVRRLRSVAFDWAGGYVAHHYTRYLGDLAGGQVVGSLLKRTYGVTGPGALFYDFATLGSPSVFRKRYRALLDGAPWDEAERQRVVDETLMAFELNIAVLADLARTIEDHRAA
ncbi:biliverdin-producing heme oxygenase [Prauserella sp. PE36]|uniref:Biliverdin-producing heme oxygenase n=1 Tax=Prauserella endophytica TaxID=1592324 RepID=A0ABY2S182_9PSEU|nr:MULTISPECIES: biliverdin-producing heme oxygenase [Prauserella]PXY37062.1 heme oxygenase [Prauserella coralliicola]RBM10270.1 biliverdin-producing heme oxygenase [Prauserella sp. PE36]TKG68417.1 biliverdin-producing heme oxygenase [Prauserella endophytica]